jgi:uncharacterized protein YecE (DUF72 family)
LKQSGSTIFTFPAEQIWHPAHPSATIVLAMLDLDPRDLPPSLLLGTSSWSWPDWRGILYSEGCKEKEFIGEYARKLPTVEIDSTFYRSPSATTVKAWDERTPPGFIFSAKVPQAITHERYLVGCQEELRTFLDAMSILGPKLGPLVFQFQYVAKGKDPKEYQTGEDFRRRLTAFLKELPNDFRYAVEVRNRTWLVPDLMKILGDHGVALVLSDYYTMPRLPDLVGKIDPITADFAYVRFLGDRKKVDDLIAKKKAAEGKVHAFDDLLVDRAEELRTWIPALIRVLNRTQRLFVYFNNHYAGCGPRSVEMFARMWREGGQG